MQSIVSNSLNGTIIISDQYDIDAATSSIDATPYFYEINDTYTISLVNLQDVKKFTSFTYSTIDSAITRYLTASYRVSRNGTSWTDWLDLENTIDNFPIVDEKDPLYIDIKWIRGGSSLIGDVRLLDYQLEGEITRDEVDGEATIQLGASQSIILKPPFIYKVFKITDIEILSTGDIDNVDIKYRFSQDTEKTWSNWEPFTKENITTVRINPIRFFQIEYSITNNSSSSVKIYDINLIGDFQNVTEDYKKTNLYGIRTCCQSSLSPGGSNNMITGQNCDPNVFKPLTADQIAKLYNPYQQNAAIDLLNKLSNDAQQVFGFKVIYFITDPDKKGQDHTLHEYQLYNVVCEGEVKVSVDQNNFPDSQIVMNQFDLNLFETMEVHITKEQFKQIFGPHRRPAKEDFLYFCDVNRMFQVEHAQQFRGFNNSSVYYKLILKKFNQKSNVQAGSQQIQDRLNQLTNNTTIDQLFGIENVQDKSAVANKDQFKPLTKDPIRYSYFVDIDKELIENGPNIISKSNYDLSTITFSTTAIQYKNLDSVIKVSDNIGFMMWFSINNYIEGETYSLFNYYDETNQLGWKSTLINDVINVNLNSATYSYNLGSGTYSVDGLSEDTWYCYVLNIDQRQRTMQQYIYKRDVEDEEDAVNLDSTILDLVYENDQDIVPVEFELEDMFGEILASDMKVTNIRLFIDVIPKDTHNKILNQYIIREDSKYLVFADNATQRLYLPNYPLGNEQNE